jgi:uncharacterized protein (TIRG00374 family)
MRKIWIQFLKVIVSGLLIALLLNKINTETLAQTFQNVRFGWIIAALVLFSASHFPGAFQWKRLLDAQGVRIPFFRILCSYFTGLFFNNLLIGGIGGDVYRIMDIRRISGRSAAAVSTVFLDRVMGLFVLSSMAVISVPGILFQSEVPVFFRWFILLIIASWGFVVCFFFIKRFAGFFSRIIKKLLPAKLHLKSVDIYNSIHDFTHQPKLFFQVTILSIVVQTARVWTHAMLAQSLGCSISAGYFFLFIPMIAILSSLPISIGGIGLREQSGIILFAAAGMAGSDALAMEFMSFLVLAVSSLPGVVCFIIGKGSRPNRPKFQDREKSKLTGG